jgi:hypothetical protein
MRKDRLLKLAEFLETKQFNEEEKFDLNIWKEEDECGTAACAIGWSASIFKDEGLKIIKGNMRYIPVYELFRKWEAVENFFEISHEETLTLFSARSYYPSNNHLAVVKRIREFVKEKEV